MSWEWFEEQQKKDMTKMYNKEKTSKHFPEGWASSHVIVQNLERAD